MLCALFLIFVAVAQAAYPPAIKDCTEYFGDGTDSKDKLISVVDPDVPALFCDLFKMEAPCTFVHHSGPESACAPPTPPDKCHRYLKVTYKEGGCDALLGDAAAGLAGKVDTKEKFDTSTGIYEGCKDGVEKTEVMCWAPKKAISSEPPPNFPDDYDVEKCDCEDVTAGKVDTKAKAAYPPAIKACTEYFGDGTDSKDKLISVVDPDVPALFCDLFKMDAPCTFVHRSGPESACVPPTPPDKCHHYLKVTYKEGGCDALLGEAAAGLAGKVDTKGKFDTSTGIYEGCKDGVEKTEVMCWAPKKAISSKPPPNFPDDYDVEKCACEDLTAEYEVSPGLKDSEQSGGLSVSSAGPVTLGFALFVAGGIAVAWRRRSFQDSHEEEGTELLEASETEIVE